MNEEMEKLLANIVNESESCIMLGNTKNTEGKSKNFIRLKFPGGSKDLHDFLDGVYVMLSEFNKILIEQEILPLESLQKMYSATLMTADLAIIEGVGVRDIIDRINKEIK